MRKYAFCLQKGGVGKTSLSGSTAFMLAQQGYKTIMIDCDPQGNLSSWYLTQAPDYELADVLFGKVTIDQAIHQVRDNLYILQTFGLDGELKTFGENQLANEPFIFEDLSQELERLGFEYGIFDLSPGMNRLERMVLLAMDEVVTPMLPEYFSLDGIEIFTNEIQKIRKSYKRDTVQHQKIICNGYNSAIGQHREIAEKMPNAYQSFIIPVEPAFRKAQSQHIAIHELNRSEKAKQKTLDELRRLTETMTWH